MFQLWTTHDMFVDRQTVLRFPDGTSIELKLDCPVKLTHILQAELQLGNDWFRSQVSHSGLLLSPDQWIPAQAQYLDFQMGFGFGMAELQPQGLNELTMHRFGRHLTTCAGLLDGQFLSPLTITLLLESWPTLTTHCIASRCVPYMPMFGLLLHDAHWIVFSLVCHGSDLLVCWCDGLLGPCPSMLVDLVFLFQTAWRCDTVSWKFAAPVAQIHGSNCGALALLNLGILLGLWTSYSHEDAVALFDALLASQWRQGFGPQDEKTVIAWLEDFLPSKGVAIEAVTARAQAAIKRLGLSPIQEAIKQKDPWRALKNLGHARGKPFQWVTYDELQVHIQNRESSKFHTKQGPKPRKPRGKATSAIVALSPDTLELFPTSFVDAAADEPVGPIAFPEVVANARGICIVTPEQAAQLGNFANSLSSDALAIVSIGELPEICAEKQTTLMWPAFYTPTREPVLVKGTLANLGDISISLATVDDAPPVSVLDTAVIRMLVGKDLFEKDWSQLVKGPVKYIISLLTALQPCQDSECNHQCKFFHPSCDEEVAQPVLDVWSWKWTSDGHKVVPATKAEFFSAFARIPLSALSSVLCQSGWFGIFIEPRPDSKQGTHPLYAVIWLPRHTSITQAMDCKRRTDNVLGLARMGNKLGLRTLKKHEAAVNALIHPGQDMALCTVRCIYEVGPLPHGLSPPQVAQLLKAWKWLAKPLRPNRSTADGQFWDIGTSDDPPAAILHTDHGSVTVTVKKDRTNTGSSAPQIQASVRTRKHMMAAPSSASSSSNTDPWLRSDPWQGYEPVSEGQEVIFTDGRTGTSTATKSKIEAMEERLFNEMEKRFAAPPGLEKQTEAELKLQTEVKELQAQTTQFKTWFNDIGSRFVGVDQKLAAQQGRMDELHSAMKDTVVQTQSLQKDVSNLNASFRAELQSSMESQTLALTTKLEALLEKRQRHS